MSIRDKIGCEMALWSCGFANWIISDMWDWRTGDLTQQWTAGAQATTGSCPTMDDTSDPVVSIVVGVAVACNT